MRYLHTASRFSRGRAARSNSGRGFTPLEKKTEGLASASKPRDYLSKLISRTALAGRSLAGFTVLEITIIVVVVAILASLAVVAYFRVTSKAENTEALNNLAAVRKAQVSEFAETGSYVNATDTAEINRLLPEADIQDKNFTYKVVNATAEDFAAVAERVGEDATGEKPLRSRCIPTATWAMPILQVRPMAATAVLPAAVRPAAGLQGAALPAVCREGLRAALPAGHQEVHQVVLQTTILPTTPHPAAPAAVLSIRTSRPFWAFFKGRPMAAIIMTWSIRPASR